MDKPKIIHYRKHQWWGRLHRFVAVYLCTKRIAEAHPERTSKDRKKVTCWNCLRKLISVGTKR